ncbi:MAG: sodium:calcium antiporter, partial [Candidatus Berkelbacteria bacterium]
MDGSPIIWLILLFLASAAVIWFAGVVLAKTTDSIDTRFRLGEALGGMILLGITGTLPEIAILISAAIAGQTEVIIGNLVGGIAIQTVVIIFFDFAIKGKRPLSYHAGAKILSLEGLSVIGITALAILAMKVPASASVFHMNPLSIVMFLFWLTSLFLIDKARKYKSLYTTLDDAQPGRMHHERRAVENHKFYASKSTAYVIVIFIIASIATLIAGVFLERSGTSIAAHFGIGAGIFAATFMSLVSALPEISTGLESIFIGDNQLAISDIFGGNIMMPALFIVADLILGRSVISDASPVDQLFAFLGIVLTAVYVISFLVRPKNRYLRLGIDSIIVVLLYIAGIY